MSKDKKPDNDSQAETKNTDFSPANNAPAFVLNSLADKTRFKEQAHINLMAIRAQLEILPTEAIFQHDPVDLVYLFGNIERQIAEMQELLIESQ
ncbi:hypothetical protein MNBD_GAMMA11-707 [hydrothermal vent metagenome]|uniref:Uncharacterized protein n=1 Tax=hydrothermal vent metagenome TaxID=652676 RepID=A0A3B0WSV4_9ZZZZ